MLQRNSNLANAVKTDRETPLHMASEKGHVECVIALINLGNAEVGAKTYYCGSTPLHVASENGRIKCVKALVEKFKAEVNVMDYSNNTSLHRTC